MKKVILVLIVLIASGNIFAQRPTEQMMQQWRQFKQQRDASQNYRSSEIPLADEISSTAPKAAPKALPADRIWYPGEWEEVKAIVVTPYYSYDPDTNLGAGYYMADPVVTGVAEFFKYNTSRGEWNSTGIYGPYKSTMDTNSSIGKVFFYLMDGIQQGHAEAWVRVEHRADTAKVLRTLARLGLRHDSVRFILGPGNSFWYRDCGPICFYYGSEDSVAMMDFEYYPGRALDDSLPSLICTQMGIPNYINTIEWEGGNCLVDGVGFLFTSDAIYANNSDSRGQITWDGVNTSSIHYSRKSTLTQGQVRNAMRALIGQRELHVLPAYKYDGGTGHIDLYADMCEENGFVFSVMPDVYSSWRDYRTGAANIDSLCSYTSCFGRPYYKASIPFPSKDNGANFSNQTEYDYNYTRTYSNHTFVNDVILQPCFSSVSNGQPTAAWDRQNIEKIRQAYPGYTIYPVDVRTFDGSGGAIHCITKQIPADNPVRILHQSVVGSATDMRGSNIPITAYITNRSGIDHAECHYRIDGGEWQQVSLAHGANDIQFTATLPTAGINERVIDTAYVPGTRIDSTLAAIDTIVTFDTVILSFDSVIVDSVTSYIDTVYGYIADTSFTFHFAYDTTFYTDTVTTLRDTLVTIEYYLSATSRNGKTITKPITAHQGGYYSFFYDGQLTDLDSNRYDFGLHPLDSNDITFPFDSHRTTEDPGRPIVGIDNVAAESFGQFYPNPATHQAHIAIDLGNGGNWQVDIVDNLGRIVHNARLQAYGNITFTLQADKLPAGAYSVVFTNGSTRVVRRLIVR